MASRRRMHCVAACRKKVGAAKECVSKASTAKAGVAAGTLAEEIQCVSWRWQLHCCLPAGGSCTNWLSGLDWWAGLGESCTGGWVEPQR